MSDWRTFCQDLRSLAIPSYLRVGSTRGTVGVSFERRRRPSFDVYTPELGFAVEMFGDPYILAEVSSGLVFTSDVHSTVNSKKRKRSEIALGIDREGVSIYDVCAQLDYSVDLRGY